MGELETEIRSVIASRVRDKMKGDESTIEEILKFPENAGANFGGTDAPRWIKYAVDLASGTAEATVRLAAELDRLRRSSAS